MRAYFAVSAALVVISCSEADKSSAAITMHRDGGADRGDGATDDAADASMDASDDAADASMDAAPAVQVDATTPAPDANVSRLCDGTDTVRLYVLRAAGGEQSYPGQAMLFENGAFFSVSGQCVFQGYRNDGLAYEGLLTDSQARDISSRLLLDQFHLFAGQYTRNGCGYEPENYWFGGSRITIEPRCPIGGMGNGTVLTISDAVTATFSEMASFAKPLQGAVRYVLVVEEEDLPSDDLAYRNAPEWPLEGDPSSVALAERAAASYEPGNSLRAEGDEANALRAIRSAKYAGEIGFAESHIIPIEQPDGRRFRLYVRDALPQEDARGLLPPGSFP